MCGIVGYIGENFKATDVILNGLELLEYRGYDSCGLAILQNEKILVQKDIKDIHNLKEKMPENFKANIGIGHTRWATHGEANIKNCHPHLSCDENIAVVHNGIIENYQEIKKKLIKKGHKFKSETDSEVIVHLIEDNYKGNLKKAIIKSLKFLVGSYAIAVFCKDEPDKLIVAKHDSPLIIGIGKNENIIASDVSAVLKYTKKVIFLEDNQIGILGETGFEIVDTNGINQKAIIQKIDWNLEEANKKGYKHFMLKEIYEQPKIISNVISGKIKDDFKVKLNNIDEKLLKNIERIIIVACGTSYHSGLVAREIFEKELKIPTEVEIASEYRYKEFIATKNALYIVISQSGETAATLAVLREIKEKRLKVVGIVNVVGSSIARESSGVIYTNAGSEISVASTKAFTAQLISLYLLMTSIGIINNKISTEREKQIILKLKTIPKKIEQIFKHSEEIKKIAKDLKKTTAMFYIGRNINYPIALEGSLKIKEVAYLHAQGYPSGELKHGAIALIDKDMPTVAICLKNSSTYLKSFSNIKEICARKGIIIAIGNQSDRELADLATYFLPISEIEEIFSPLLTVVYMQFLAYYFADQKKINVDKPKNLAKSVTVE